MEASTITQIVCGIMDEHDDELGCPSSSSSGDSSSSSSEFMDDATSSPSSSSSSTPSLVQHQKGTALFEMSSLMAQLPFKGLSKHFEGKSQSFASLSSVRCLEDLAKPERPNHRRKLKPCKSYGGGLDAHTHRPCCCSRAISKKPSRGARHGFLGGGAGGGRPPVPPHRSGGFSARTLLFA